MPDHTGTPDPPTPAESSSIGGGGHTAQPQSQNDDVVTPKARCGICGSERHVTVEHPE